MYEDVEDVSKNMQTHMYTSSLSPRSLSLNLSAFVSI